MSQTGLGDPVFQGALWPHLIRYAFDSNNDEFTRLGIPYSVYHYKKRLLSEIGITGTAPPGRLGQSAEGGGKKEAYRRYWQLCQPKAVETLPRLVNGRFTLRPMERLIKQNLWRGEMHIFSFFLK